MLKSAITNRKIKLIAIYVLILFLVAAFSVLSNTPDYDIWSRLIMGSHVINHGSVMYNDIISYTPTHTWYDSEWLTSTIFFVAISKFGFVGATVLKFLLVFLALLTVGINIHKQDNDLKYQLIYLVICCLVMYQVDFFSALRCQNITFIFYPLLILILELFRNKSNSKLIYFIPLLFLFWINMHGASVYGLIMLLLYALGSFLNKKTFKIYLFIFIASAIIYLINPWGIDFIKFTWGTLFVNRGYILEWKSPFSGSIDSYVYIILLYIALLIFRYIYSFKTKKSTVDFDWVKILVILSNAILALMYVKLKFMFFLSVFIFMYQDIKFFFDLIFNSVKKSDIILKVINSFVALCVLIFSYISLYNHPLISSWYTYDFSMLPIPTLQFLKDNDIKGNLLTHFQYAGVIAYINYPDIKIYMDGRQEQVYDYKIANDLMHFIHYDIPNANKILSEHKTDILLVHRASGANAFLETQDYYMPVLKDGALILYLAPSLQKSEYIYPKHALQFDEKSLFVSKYKF